MNEYAGFKVGDKVKIIKSEMSPSCAPMEGVIKRFGDFKVGGFAEVDTVEVFIGESCFDICYLLRHNVICKLPKYAVGDVVRVKSFEQIKREFPKLEANGVCFCTHAGKYDMSKFCGKLVTLKPHKYDGLFTIEESNGGCNWADDFLEPFDGFRVGDTVWTVKRGKGKIIGNVYDNAERPFAVDFSVPNGIFLRWHTYDGIHYPKLSNLIPTEAKYKEATKPKFYDRKLTGTMHFENVPIFGFNPPVKIAGCDEIKVNDAVLYRGKKWMVEQITTKTQQFEVHPSILLSEDYVLRRSDHMGGYKAVVSREDIYLWEETSLERIERQLRENKEKLAAITKEAKEKQEQLDSMKIRKFKVGDTVFFPHIGNSLSTTKDPNKYIVDRYYSGFVVSKRWDGLAIATCKESDLRLWRETKFTHCLQSESDTWYASNYNMSSYKSITFLGKINRHDTFLCETSGGGKVLFRGEAGDNILTFDKL